MGLIGAMTHPRYTPLIESLPETVPFVGAEVQERQRGAPFRARIGANENVFGPSPRAVEAMRAATPDIWIYGDSASHDLRSELAARLGIDMDNLVVGEGIDGLLGQLVRLVVAPGDAVVTSDGAYPTFNYHVAGFGGVLHKVPYRDDAEDLGALIARAGEVDAKLVYLANPDNPMGSYLTGAAIAAALEDLPEGCLLVLDEAYVEFAPEGTAPPLVADDPRLIRMRTFSKAYGLAGARVGYAIGAPALIRAFDKIRNHFGMGRLSQIGALEALRDDAHLDWVKRQVEIARQRITAIARANGLAALPSATNFVAVDCGADAELAKRLVAELGKRDVFVRMPFAAPQNRCIRISAGTEADLNLLEEVLPAALKAARAGG